MAFEYGENAVLEVEIEGTKYLGTVDNADIIDFWANNSEELQRLSKLTTDIGDEEVANSMREFVSLVVGFTAALLGPEAAQRVFNGRERSLLFCVALMDYLNSEIESQGLFERLEAASRKYSAAKVIG